MAEDREGLFNKAVPSYNSITALANGGNQVSFAGPLSNGVVAMAGASGYRNGVYLGAINFAPNSEEIYIGTDKAQYASVKIQCVAFYNTVLTAGQVSAITTAMNALSGSTPPQYNTTITRDIGTKYAGTASAKIVTTGVAYPFTQSINVGDTNTYTISTYAYTDGSAVTSSDVELYYNSVAITTNYTSVGSGWYLLTGSVTGANESRTWGVEVKASKTVYVDNFSVSNYASTGTLTSSIFDRGTDYTAYGTLSYSATTPASTTATVKIRTGNQSNLSDATDFTLCDTITNNTDISSNNCVTDNHRYVQYQIALATSDTTVTPTFQDFSFVLVDLTPPAITLDSLTTPTNNPVQTGTATDAIGTVSSVQFKLDSGTFTNCTADDNTFDEQVEDFTCAIGETTEGSHTISIRSTDSNANTTAEGNYSTTTFTYDSLSPTITLSSLTDNLTNDNTPTLSGQTSDSDTIATIEFQIDQTSGSWTNCTADDNTFDESQETFTCTTQELEDGSHVIYLRGTDGTGNTTQSANYLSYTFTGDTHEERVSISNDINIEVSNTESKDADKRSQTITNKKSPEISGENPEASNGRVILYRKTSKGTARRIDSTSIDGEGEWSFDAPKHTSKTVHYAIKITDQAGNTSERSHWFTLVHDTVDPVFLRTLPKGFPIERGQKISFPAEDEGSGIENYKVKLDSYHTNWKKTQDTESFWRVPDDAPEGVYSFTVKVTDKAGNKKTQKTLLEIRASADSRQETPDNQQPAEVRGEVQGVEDSHGQQSTTEPEKQTVNMAPASEKSEFKWWNPWTW